MIHQIISYVAVAAGLLSAILWWKAATTVVRRGDDRAAGNTFLGDVAIQATFKAQSKFNAWAAVATGIAALAAAVAQLFSN